MDSVRRPWPGGRLAGTLLSLALLGYSALAWSDDVYLAGRSIEVITDTDGDVVAAGGHVATHKQVTGDILAVGGVVDVGGTVRDDVRVAAGDVLLRAHIDGDSMAAGGTVTVAPEAVIGGKAWLAGGEVTVSGHILKTLKISAGRVHIAGNVDGDAEVVAREIEIASGARIGGRLSYRSPVPARIDARAHIVGPVEVLPLTVPAQGLTSRSFPLAKSLFLAGLMVTGVVLLSLLPGLSLQAARTIASDPWASLGLGLVLLAGTPLAGVLLLISIIGIPLAWALLSLYALSLLAAYLATALFVGDTLARLTRHADISHRARMLFLIVALLALFLLGYVPMVGGIIQFVALVLGLGAWALCLYRWHNDRLAAP